jgi:hypothetical protein
MSRAVSMPSKLFRLSLPVLHIRVVVPFFRLPFAKVSA